MDTIGVRQLEITWTGMSGGAKQKLAEEDDARISARSAITVEDENPFTVRLRHGGCQVRSGSETSDTS